MIKILFGFVKIIRLNLATSFAASHMCGYIYNTMHSSKHPSQFYALSLKNIIWLISKLYYLWLYLIEICDLSTVQWHSSVNHKFECSRLSLFKDHIWKWLEKRLSMYAVEFVKSAWNNVIKMRWVFASFIVICVETFLYMLLFITSLLGIIHQKIMCIERD